MSSRGEETLIYPSGCREVKEDLSPDELIRRLKTLAHTFQSMGQDDDAGKYKPLALHLATDYFLMHQSKDVQLLIACCIADVLRVFAPEAPYKDPQQIKDIFVFLIKQLSGLKDPKDPAFKRYFYLLENLAYVKSFNMCFELDDCQEIFCSLFQLMFRIVNDEHSGKVKSFMLDVLCPLITESDNLSNELLDTILINIVEPNKSQRKNAYSLAKELIVKCSDTLESYIQAFFNQVLILQQEPKELSIASKVYDLIYELNHICPTVLLAVLPQLEFKLKSTDEKERLGAVSLLARMFSEKDSTLAIHHRPLWQAFLGRYNDISVAIRTKCVQYSMHFLLNHPELRNDITQTLKLRQHDAEEHVRYEVVMAIVATAKKDFNFVADSEDLLEYVRERTLDKKFKIRREAMTGLAMIYRNHLIEPFVSEGTRKAATWIKDKILHCYYMAGLDDKLLVEKLLNTSLVPFTLPTEERMKKLYYLLGTVDENATKAFVELEKLQLSIRKLVSEMLELQARQPDEERDKELNLKIQSLAKHLPEPVKALEFLKKFSAHMTSDPTLLSQMEIVMNPCVSCKQCSEIMTQILKKLGQPVMTNLYYNTVKMLLERTSSVMVDHEAIKVLVGYVEQCLKLESLIEELRLDRATAGERGLNLLKILAYVFPSHFLHEDVINHLMRLLDIGDQVPPLILTILTLIGKYKPIGAMYPNIMADLVPKCQQFIDVGAPKDAKHAIRCLYHNIPEADDKYKNGVFTTVVEKVKDNLVPGNENYLTAIVALGHLAYNMPNVLPVAIKNTISRKIVKELLMKDRSEDMIHDCDKQWCSEEELPIDTLCKVKGLKTMALWLLGLKLDTTSAIKTFRMIDAFILGKGDLLGSHHLSMSEMAWLRLAAGCCMLKICEQKGVGDQFTAVQFFNLSQLMTDPVPEVRERFASKLHQGLCRRIPVKCLPLDFMGYYALAGNEEDKRIKKLIHDHMTSDIQRRRDYIKAVTASGSVERALNQLPHLMPDFMLVFAVPVLAHDPTYTVYNDRNQLQKIQKCLWFILEPLMLKNDNYCFGFYKNLIERMKNHLDAVQPTDEIANKKLWAVCDIAMGLVMSKTTNYEMKEFPTMPRVPPMYFKKHEDNSFVNINVYVPAEFTVQQMKKSMPITSSKRGRKDKNATQASPNNGIDVPTETSDTKIQLPGFESEESATEGEQPAKKTRTEEPGPSKPIMLGVIQPSKKYGQARGGRGRRNRSPTPEEDEDDPILSDEDELPSTEEIEKRSTRSYNRRRRIVESEEEEEPMEEESVEPTAADKEEEMEEEEIVVKPAAKSKKEKEEKTPAKSEGKTGAGRRRKQPLQTITEPEPDEIEDKNDDKDKVEETDAAKKRGRRKAVDKKATEEVEEEEEEESPSPSKESTATESSSSKTSARTSARSARSKASTDTEKAETTSETKPTAKQSTNTRKVANGGVSQAKPTSTSSAQPVRHSTRQTRQSSAS